MASAGMGGFWAEFINRSWIATSMRNLAAVAILLSLHTVDCRGQTTIVGANTPVKRALGEIKPSFNSARMEQSLKVLRLSGLLARQNAGTPDAKGSF
jgi:hypothetical protein